MCFHSQYNWFSIKSYVFYFSHLKPLFEKGSMNFTRYWKVWGPETWISLGLEGKGTFLESTHRIWNLNSFLSDPIIFALISTLYWALGVRAILLAFLNTIKTWVIPACLTLMQLWEPPSEHWREGFSFFHPKDQSFSDGGGVSSFIIFEEFHSISPHTHCLSHLQGTSPVTSLSHPRTALLTPVFIRQSNDMCKD